jgi:hypothetical protein
MLSDFAAGTGTIFNYDALMKPRRDLLSHESGDRVRRLAIPPRRRRAQQARRFDAGIRPIAQGRQLALIDGWKNMGKWRDVLRGDVRAVGLWMAVGNPQLPTRASQGVLVKSLGLDQVRSQRHRKLDFIGADGARGNSPNLIGEFKQRTRLKEAHRLADEAPHARQPSARLDLRRQRSACSLYDFFTRFAQVRSFCRCASFLFCVGTNCAMCALHCSSVRAAEVEEVGAAPEAQAVALSARTETQDRVINVFME